MLRFHSAGEIGHRIEQGDELNTLGCPNLVCRGYELMRDLDFRDANSYRDPDRNGVMQRWTGLGWDPPLP